jgi:hypothetical protein
MSELVSQIDEEFLDYCNNRLPARIARVEEQPGADNEPSRILLHLEGLIEPKPNDVQWDGAYHVARRFGLNPGKTRWEHVDADERGRHRGVLIFERWHAHSN